VNAMHRKATPSPFSWQTRAELFAQLAAMEKSGLPAAQAFGLLKLPASSQPRVAMTSKLLTRGVEISVAGCRSGLFTELEATLIGTATSAGSPASTYRRLAEYYAQRATQARAIKSRLALPGFVLITGLFVQPLPALLGGSLRVSGYLLHCLIPLTIIAAVISLAADFGKKLEGPPSATRAIIEKVLLTMPLFGPMLIRCNIRDFFESLALMLEAGMPLLQALPKALKTVQLSEIRNAFARVQLKIERGNTLAQALADISVLHKGHALALIHTGEESGMLPEMLFRYAAAETGAINNFHRQVADWLPRIIYIVISCWAAYGILSGVGVGPNLPSELR
jgi:general secretion pathway protein F